MIKGLTTTMRRSRIVLLIVLLGLSTGMLAMAGHGNPNACGQSLGEWLNVAVGLWRNARFPTDSYGNTVVGKVVLLGDSTEDSGDGAPEALDLTLSSGEAFVLPFFGVMGSEISNGGYVAEELSFFKTLDIKVKVDGVVLVNRRNVMDYYAENEFDPPIPYIPDPEHYPDYIVNFAFLQAVGMVHHPLSVGKHVVTLDVKNTQPFSDEYGGGYAEYHNTWNITVKRGK